MEMRITLKGMDDAIKRFDTRAVAKVAAMACNRAATHGRAQMVKLMRDEYAVTARKVREDIKIDKASMYNLKAVITAPRSPIALSWFKVKGGGKRRTPALVQVTKSGGYKPVGQGAFVMTVNGRKLVVKRQGKERIPTKFVMGPSLGGAIKGRLQKPLEEKIQGKLNEEFRRGLENAMNKGRVGQSGDYA